MGAPSIVNLERAAEDSAVDHRSSDDLRFPSPVRGGVSGGHARKNSASPLGPKPKSVKLDERSAAG